MNSNDPDFAKISSRQLAAIDALCSEYETKRTQGADVSIEAYLLAASDEIRSPLCFELIQVEMEILDAWDQLTSPEALIQRFPELEAFINQQWQLLKDQTGPGQSSHLRKDTGNVEGLSGSTHVDDRHAQPPLKSENARPIIDEQSHRFRIVRNLAQGGIGTVFVAFDRDLQREVAIKELKKKFASVQSVVQRFEAEATVTGNLEHPNIVPIYATGRRSDGRPYYAMRLIRGRSMQAAISELHKVHDRDVDFRNNVAARDLLLRFVTVCRAVGFAHSRGVLHRDLKLSNIMVGDFGETLVVDWGLARKLHAADPASQRSMRPEARGKNESEKTLNGTIVGTPGYMSPEQAMGRNEELTTATDIYSLGATLFQILTNNLPHIHTGSASANPAHAGGSATMNASQDPTKVCVESRTRNVKQISLDKLDSLPAPLRAICRHAMQLNPLERYSSAELLAVDVEAWLMDEPVSVLPETRFEKLRRWSKVHPAMVGGGLASLLVALLAMGVTLSILSVKNESLRLANFREQAAAQKSLESAAVAKTNGNEAVRQRQRVLGILNTFLFDVERGLSNVPGGSAVQRNVLTTVLNKLGEISDEFADNQVNESNAAALIELGDLFSRVGTKDIKLNLPHLNKSMLAPLDAAGEMYAEAMKIVVSSTVQGGKDSRQMIAMIKQKQAEVLQQTARTPKALELLDESLAIRRQLLSETPDAADAALDVAMAVDYLGQIHLIDGDFSRARDAFLETQSILTRLYAQSLNEEEIQRRLGIAISRLADIAVHDGNLDLAARLYDQDMTITAELYNSKPNNLTAKRDYCTSLDRIGNMSVQRGHLAKAMDTYLKSRELREELRAAEPTNFKSSLELIVSLMKVGDTRMLLKEVAEAQADYEKALLLADELARVDPQNATVRRFQSMSAEVLADVAIAQLQFDDALRHAKKSLAISLELVAKDPTDGQMQRDLYICYAKVAKVLLEMKDFEECLVHLGLALNIVQPIYERQPKSLQSIGDYSFLLIKRAEAYLEAGKASSASEALEKTLAILESVPAANRQDAKSRRRLANAKTMLGRAFLADGKTQQARLELENSRQLTFAMIEENVRVEQMRQDLIEIETLIASIGSEE